MVKSFLFAKTPKIIFGSGVIQELSPLIKKYGNNVLLVTGASSFINSKAGEYLINTFEMTGILYHHLIISREPFPELIDNAVVRYQNISIDVVVAIGGGSVIDAGKAVAAMLYKDESVTEYLEGIGKLIHPGTTLPFIAVPTTAGTGSETTKNAVISNVGTEGYKRSLRHDNFIPEIALVDPELTLNCSPDLTAATGMDCFTQLVESYLSTKATSLTDSLALEGIKALIGSLETAWRMGQNIEARTSMSYAAMISGICLANAGLGAVHGFASSVGGLFNIPHGTLCGTLMAPANNITVKKLRETGSNIIALKKYSTLGRLISTIPSENDDFYIDYFISRLSELSDNLNIERLSKFGIKEKDISLIVEKTDIKTHPIKLSDDDLKEILYNRL